MKNSFDVPTDELLESIKEEPLLPPIRKYLSEFFPTVENSTTTNPDLPNAPVVEESTLLASIEKNQIEGSGRKRKRLPSIQERFGEFFPKAENSTTTNLDLPNTPVVEESAPRFRQSVRKNGILTEKSKTQEFSVPGMATFAIKDYKWTPFELPQKSERLVKQQQASERLAPTINKKK